MIDLIFLQTADLIADLSVVLTLIYLVWIFGWGKKALGSAKLSIILAVIIVFLVFIKHPELVWIPLIIILLITVGKEMVSKMLAHK